MANEACLRPRIRCHGDEDDEDNLNVNGRVGGVPIARPPGVYLHLVTADPG